MIQKVNILKNIGKFYHYSPKGAGLVWHKNTFLFAPNAYGKSTLANIFRSLQSSDPTIILARKTINSTSCAEAVFKIDNENHVFNGKNWNKPFPNIHIFDVQFIHDNIFSQAIEHAHRKNIHKIIIGELGVKIAKELAELKSEEKIISKQFEKHIKAFTNAGFTQTLTSFLEIPASEEGVVAARIKKLEHEIKSKESEDLVRSLQQPEALLAPIIDLSGLNNLLKQKICALHEEVEKRVISHIEKNFKEKALAKQFIRHGLESTQADCPFCGQDLKNASELMTAYRNYFDESFRLYQERLTTEATKFSIWNLENELSKLNSLYHSNVAKIKKWEPFIGIAEFQDASDIVEKFRVHLIELKSKTQAEIEKKQKDPNAEVSLLIVDRLGKELLNLKDALNNYNLSIIQYDSNIENFIQNLPKIGLESLKRDLAIARETEKRFLPEWKKWVVDYGEAKQEFIIIEERKNAKQLELESYTKDIFDKYQKSINKLLASLGADFSIADLAGKTDDKATEAYSDFAFLILEKRIPLSARADSPSFKNTLSEGDKSTLAFAFFMAALEQSANLEKQIVIFDDPLSSLDETRREATARLLLALSPGLKQMCVFTHKKDFLLMLTDKMPEHNALQIRTDKKNGSRLEVFDVEHNKKSDFVIFIDQMERYILEDFGPTPDIIQGNIRKVFEIILKTKYYRVLKDEIRSKKGFAKLLEKLFDDGLLDMALQPTLFDLCSVTNGPHHGEIVDAQPPKLSRDEIVPLIQETFSLLNKV